MNYAKSPISKAQLLVMMLCRTVVINFISLEIFTQAVQQISTGRGGAPTIRRRRGRRRVDAKFSAAAAPAKTRQRRLRRRRRGWHGVGL
jgi:hypothetical protein